MKGYLIEIFSSRQGEGVYAGVPQIFIRLAGCNLRCNYCDTPESWIKQKTYRVETPAESQIFQEYDNPIPLDEILAIIKDYKTERQYHSVSVTGGEPLLQVEFLQELLPQVRALGLPIYFETNGTMSDKLARIIDLLDIVALDIKLPSCPGVKMDWDDAANCVSVSARKDLMIKVVITQDSKDEEVKRAAKLARNANAPVILQPATPVNDYILPPDDEKLVNLKKLCGNLGCKTVVIPQIHKLVGWL